METAPASADETLSRSAVSSGVFDNRDAPSVERAGVDAAPSYKDAFALYDQLSAEERRMVASPHEGVDAGQAAALFKKIQPIMDLLRRGAAADYCDWGFGN